jgi:hypothetical protein
LDTDHCCGAADGCNLPEGLLKDEACMEMSL